MAERLVHRPQEVERLRLARELGVSDKRLNGWEPTTVQRGYDQHGQPCAIGEAWQVVTESESEWDDGERAKMLGLAKFEGDLCACGWHESMATDKSNVFTFETKTCPVCAGHAQFARIQLDGDEKKLKAMGENPPPRLPRPGDGRRTFSRLLTSDEVKEAATK